MKFNLSDVPLDIGFENSFVERLDIAPYTITMFIDFHLHKIHPLYQPVKPDEWGCFRYGTLKVFDFKNLSWEATGSNPATDADGSKSWNFDYFTKIENIWTLGGDWGEIKVSGDKTRVSIEWSEDI